MIFAGIDIGSTTTETVLLDEKQRIVASSWALTGIGLEAAADETLQQCLTKSGHRQEEIGYCVSTGYLNGIRCYFTGDTDATRECAAVQCELAVVPVGGEFTMNVEEAAALVREMCPAIAIPVHYGSIVGDSEAGRRFAKGVESFTRVLLKLDE